MQNKVQPQLVFGSYSERVLCEGEPKLQGFRRGVCLFGQRFRHWHKHIVAHNNKKTNK